jgi:hypothetical protein
MNIEWAKWRPRSLAMVRWMSRLRNGVFADDDAVVVARALANPRRHATVTTLSEGREAVSFGARSKSEASAWPQCRIMSRNFGSLAGSTSSARGGSRRPFFGAIRSAPTPDTSSTFVGRSRLLSGGPSRPRLVPWMGAASGDRSPGARRWIILRR